MKSKFMPVLMLLLFGFCFMAFGQEATPTPVASPLPLEGASNFIAGIVAWLEAHAGAVGTGLGMVWIVVSKLFSTERSKGIIDVMQKWLDGIALLILGLGALLKKVSEFLATMVKSDGVLGKK